MRVPTASRDSPLRLHAASAVTVPSGSKRSVIGIETDHAPTPERYRGRGRTKTRPPGDARDEPGADHPRGAVAPLDVYLELDMSLMDVARAACVALPAAGLPIALGRRRSRGWAMVAPLSIFVVVALVTVWSGAAQAIAWTALILVPPGCALGLGWAANGARPPLAALAVPLLAVAVVVPDAATGQVARIALIAGAAVTAARLLAGGAPIPLLKAAVVAMAVVDATFIFGQLSQHQNGQFAAALPAPGLPQLQVATLGGASCDFGDFFAAALVGAILARERRAQLVAAAATFMVTQAFDQLFLIVHELPATVPPALVMLALEARRRRRVAHATPRPLHAP